MNSCGYQNIGKSDFCKTSLQAQNGYSVKSYKISCNKEKHLIFPTLRKDISEILAPYFSILIESYSFNYYSRFDFMFVSNLFEE